jgi:hypothetical protein
MDVNEHERLSNITIRHKWKQRKCFYCQYAFQSHSKVFINDQFIPLKWMKWSPAYSCAILLTSDYKHYTGHLYCLDVIWWIFSTRIQKIDYAILQILPSLCPTIHYLATNTNKKPRRAPTTLKSEGEVTSLSGADKREVRDNREKWWEYREKSKYFYN